jgi:parallel beta-helix repeat protein
MRYSTIAAILLSAFACGSSPAAPSAAAPGDAAAARSVYYVALTGNDANSGAAESPLRTIRSAVSRLRPGNTLIIRGGVYTGEENTIDSQSGTVPSGSASSPITIAANAGESVTLRPPNNVSGIRLTNGAPSFLVFQDLTIDMANSGPGSDADGVFLYTANHIRFLRIEVMNSYNFGIHFGPQTGFNEVVDSRIHNNGFPGGSETNGHGLYITGSDNTFTGNDVYANQGYGFHIYNNSGSRADPSRNLVSGNRIHGNGVHGGTAYGLLVAWGDSNRIQGNTIFENPGGILVYTNSTNTDVSNNNIYNNRPLEGIIVQYADATVVRNNTVSGNGTDIIDYGDATVFSQNSVPAKRGGPAR